MGVSNWYLFFGGLFCCTGFGLPLGIFCFVYWFYKDFMDKGITVNHKHKSTTLPIESLLGQDYREREVRINEISTKLEQKKEPELMGNIGDLKDREKYT